MRLTRGSSAIGVALSIVCIAGATSCDTPLEPDSRGVDLVVVTPPSASLQAGETVTLTALVLDAAGNAMRDRKVVWSSQNASIATVSQSGVVTGVAAGTVQVAGSSGGKSANATITVTPRPVSLVRITPGSPTIPVGSSLTLHAEALDASGAPVLGRPVAWSSSDDAIALVSAGGVVAGIAPGSATITATIDGQSGTVTITVAPQAVAAVEITPEADTIQVGRRVTFRATPLDARNLPLANRTIVWTSSDPSVASVSSAGEVVGLAAGSALIRATVEGKFAEASVVVQPVPVASVTVTPANPTLGVGQTLGMTATMRDASGNILSGRSVTWASSDAAVASVDAQGVVTAVTSGSASIIATSEGISGATLITVSLVPVARVTVLPTTVLLNPRQTSQLTATAYDANNNVLARPINWSSSNTAVATVSTAGRVTAVSSGIATISAMSGGVTGTALITVALVPVASVTVSPGAPNMFPNDVLQLTETARDAGGNVITGRPTTWSSSNTNVATVSTTGLVTAVAIGAATITATVDGVSGSATVTINQTPVASVTLTPGSISLFQGQQQLFVAEARDASNNLLQRQITWSSTDPTIVGVTDAGSASAISPGTALIVATAIGAGVGGSNVADTAQVTVSLVPVASMAISPTSVQMFLGQPPQQLSVQLFDAQGAPLSAAGRTISWGSANPAIATVSGNGATALLSSVAQGSTRIGVATAGGGGTVTDSITVTVSTAPIASLTIQPKPNTVYLGATKYLFADVRNSFGGQVRGRNINWQSRNTSIVTVAPVSGIPDSATFAGVALGSTYVDAVDPSGQRDSTLVTVSPVPVASVQVTPSTATLQLPDSVTLTAQPKDSAGGNLTRTITWVSLDPAIATVSSTTGKVNTVSSGTTSIEARAVGAGVGGATVAGSASITVTAVVHTVQVTAPRAFIVPNDTMHLSIVLRDTLGNVLTGKLITYSSSDPNVASAADSIITGGANPGPVVITVTSEGKSNTVSLSGIVAVASVAVSCTSGNCANTGDVSVPVGMSKDYTVTVSSATGPLAGRTLTIGNSSATTASVFGATTVTTDVAGQVKAVVTGLAAGSATITFTGTAREGTGGSTPFASITIVVP